MMPFYINFQVCLISLMLILPEQGRPQCYRPWPRGPGQIIPPCCMGVSKGRIQESIVSCFEQKETTFSHCRIHAFIFTTVSRSHYCIDPGAKWLSRKFRQLEKSGICCH